ncbi:MAG: hypothetical protein LHV69_09255 [Elusimicrobia bacterium]|nr:hypothetical protein [Candidatus Obscuribacterium magneticum]
MEQSNSNSSGGPVDAFIKKAFELKAQGLNNAALTEFRRAALADPAHFQVQMEMGLLFKAKSNADISFLRYAYEAFKKASHLNINSEQAHDQYILAAQRMGRLEELLQEYKALSARHPDNAFLQRCVKNIITLSMAMIPEKVSVDEGSSQTLRKAVLLISIGLFLMGLALLFAPAVIKQMLHLKLEAQQISFFVKMGLVFIALSAAGFVYRSRLRE